jgi:hypothetical protein
VYERCRRGVKEEACVCVCVLVLESKNEQLLLHTHWPHCLLTDRILSTALLVLLREVVLLYSSSTAATATTVLRVIATVLLLCMLLFTRARYLCNQQARSEGRSSACTQLLYTLLLQLPSTILSLFC